jgi:hypothetical protein
MAEENTKIIEKISELIEEGEKHRKNYSFIEFALWKNKVELLLKAFGGSHYVDSFFDCFRGTESNYQEELNNLNLRKETFLQPGALFEIIVSSHQRDMDRVLKLLSTLKIQFQESVSTAVTEGKEYIEIESGVPIF